MARLRQMVGWDFPDQPATSERDRQLVALKAASPTRSSAGRAIQDQADAAHLPLFVAGNEPTLF